MSSPFFLTRLSLLACLFAAVVAAPARAQVVDDAPVAAAQGLGDMRVFIRGSDDALWTRTWDGSSWSGWSSLGGVLTSGPAVGARPGGIYDVVVRGTDSGFHHKAYTPAGGWTAFSSLGGGFSSAPGVTYRQGTGNIDVVGTGTDGQLWFKSYAPGSGWSGWVAMADRCAATRPSRRPARARSTSTSAAATTSSTERLERLGLERLHRARGRAQLAPIGHRVGCQPPRHLRARQRQRDLTSRAGTAAATSRRSSASAATAPPRAPER